MNQDPTEKGMKLVYDSDRVLGMNRAKAWARGPEFKVELVYKTAAWKSQAKPNMWAFKRARIESNVW